jgi:peroxiredoxin Q/BCP
MTIPQVGEFAPSVTLKNQHGQDISLDTFRGKKNLVVYFYPKALTPGCTTQACAIRDYRQEFAELDTEVVGISPDAQPRLQKFAEKYQLDFHLLSDVDHAVADAFGVWGPKKFMGREYLGIIRTTFIIDKDGRLCYVMHRPNTKNHHNDVVSYIKENL